MSVDASDALACSDCGDGIYRYCSACGLSLAATTPAPVTTPAALASYSAQNQKRTLTQCPYASDVRGFYAWLKASRVVRKGQKGIKIVALVMGGDDGGKLVNIKPAYVFDVTQTDERTPRAAYRIRTGRPGTLPAGAPSLAPNTTRPGEPDHDRSDST